ncbi:hypothetical protein [Streptomyces zingiberis]|uniref:DUF4245 domain-containing protein n=1 Tax=Streptomyces zingiberis TaxID=2053010 RepID=A0ABX1BXH0_9ACTN|nr:hypothetical protein [Streptomyces zingiberis]NJQ00580.1 hypothetical protein [Streptomyces zingiberis]
MTADQYEETGSSGALGGRPRRRAGVVAVVVTALGFVVAAGVAAWFLLLPKVQGRDDPYGELPRTTALVDGGDQEVNRGGLLVRQTELHTPTSSWVRWASGGMNDIQLEIRYQLHEATPTGSGRSAAESWWGDRIAHSKKSLVDVAGVPDVGDEAGETWTSSGYTVYVRSGNATIEITYGVYGVGTGTTEQEQMRKTVRRLAAEAVQDIEEANGGSA